MFFCWFFIVFILFNVASPEVSKKSKTGETKQMDIVKTLFDVFQRMELHQMPTRKDRKIMVEKLQAVRKEMDDDDHGKENEVNFYIKIENINASVILKLMEAYYLIGSMESLGSQIKDESEVTNQESTMKSTEAPEPQYWDRFWESVEAAKEGKESSLCCQDGVPGCCEQLNQNRNQNENLRLRNLVNVIEKKFDDPNAPEPTEFVDYIEPGELEETLQFNPDF